MSRRRARSLLSRLLIAGFALWLPAVTGQGGKATSIAAESLARSLTQRPHLSCHGDKGEKKSCCCKGEQTIRAAACGCHEGQEAFGLAAYDPTLASWTSGPLRRPWKDCPAVDRPDLALGTLAEPPDPPPPRLLSLVHT